MRYFALAILALFSTSSFAQMSTEEAYQRLQERQATVRPVPQPDPRNTPIVISKGQLDDLLRHIDILEQQVNSLQRQLAVQSNQVRYERQYYVGQDTLSYGPSVLYFSTSTGCPLGGCYDGYVYPQRSGCGYRGSSGYGYRDSSGCGYKGSSGYGYRGSSGIRMTPSRCGPVHSGTSIHSHIGKR